LKREAAVVVPAAESPRDAAVSLAAPAVGGDRRIDDGTREATLTSLAVQRAEK
jgi:hypothetical protein